MEVLAAQDAEGDFRAVGLHGQGRSAVGLDQQRIHVADVDLAGHQGHGDVQQAPLAGRQADHDQLSLADREPVGPEQGVGLVGLVHDHPDVGRNGDSDERRYGGCIDASGENKGNWRNDQNHSYILDEHRKLAHGGVIVGFSGFQRFE